MRAGFVALVGRPNAGKSTLLNQILGEKLAIATPRPQTTRERLLGVWNQPGVQVGFVDTPGLHRPSGPGRNKLNQYMIDEATQALGSVDAVVLLVEPPEPPRPEAQRKGRPGRKPAPERGPQPFRVDPALKYVLDEVTAAKRPTILALNKVDTLRDKRQLLPMLEAFGKLPFAAMVPISAKAGTGVPALLEEIVKLLPEGDALFDDDTLTDRAERWFVTEFVREQVFLLTKREVPYSAAVTVDEFEELAPKPGKGRELRIAATISVDKEPHKRILVGEGGRMIREIGSRARHELGQRFDAVVHLTLFVRVDEGWAGNPRKLRELGYGE